MSIIRILPEKVTSQIAAGEVVDRPFSVVRELIDNSIDAGADRISVSIERGGRGLIKVGDNGMGMSRDDLLMCVERYSTSKIETASDLLSVKSLGFRGEALSSIASVSRMRITSRIRDQVEGYVLKISGGKLSSIMETGSPPGTIVEVGDLFFNLPARRKFLRSAKTETDHIIDTLSRIALAFPEISFQLEESGRTILNLPSSEQLQRLSALLGRKVAESMVEEETRDFEVGVKAYLAHPEFARTRGDHLFVYVNRRNIRDRAVTKAVMEGYGQRIMKGQYPQAAIFIEIDPSLVDINVHPTKQEVRFRNSRDLFQAVKSTIERALAGSFNILKEKTTFEGSFKDNVNFPGFSGPAIGSIAEASWIYAEKREGREKFAPVEEVAEKSIIREGPRVIGQLGNTYILCQVRDGLLMVDQHAAHERIVYENLKRGVEMSRIESQVLLVPHKVELTARESRILLENGEQLLNFGLELDHFGGNTFLLRSVPALLKNVQWDSLLSELIADLEEGGLGADRLLDKLLTTMACHGAIRAGCRLNNDEAVNLLSELEEMDLPTNCPHGRPIFKHFSYHEIERMFRRIV